MVIFVVHICLMHNSSVFIWSYLSFISVWCIILQCFKVISQFGSVQFKMVFAHSEKPICVLLYIRSFSNVDFEAVPVFIWLTVSLSCPFLSSTSSLHRWPPGDQWYDVLGFVPTGSVSNCSVVQIFRATATCDGCFACQSVCMVTFLDSGKSRAVHP